LAKEKGTKGECTPQGGILAPGSTRVAMGWFWTRGFLSWRLDFQLHFSIVRGWEQFIRKAERGIAQSRRIGPAALGSELASSRASGFGLGSSARKWLRKTAVFVREKAESSHQVLKRAANCIEFRSKSKKCPFLLLLQVEPTLIQLALYQG
jgi:hypothetical protein